MYNMLSIYLIGSILSIVLTTINYFMYIEDEHIVYNNSSFYINEILLQFLLMGLLSWIGSIFVGVSLYNRINEN